MTKESTTPDLEELTRRLLQSVENRDLDAAMGVYGPDSVWDLSTTGLGVHDGSGAIRAFLADWIGAYEDFEVEIEEMLDVGGGVMLVAQHLRGRPHGSTGVVELHFANVTEWNDNLISRVTSFLDIDEARAAAERLAEKRG